VKKIRKISQDSFADSFARFAIETRAIEALAPPLARVRPTSPPILTISERCGDGQLPAFSG
jgi:hypothetical protein